MKRLVTLFALTVIVSTAFAGDKTVSSPVPIAWGMLTQNAGCVIFAEGKKRSGMFYGVAATMKTEGKLTVVESQNYTLEQPVYLETQENMDALMVRAQRDNIKFVKIPEKYSPELLEKARAMCK
jgi:hypothetical protein